MKQVEARVRPEAGDVDCEADPTFTCDEAWSRRRTFTVVSLCMLSTGAQLPTFFLAGTLSFIARDLDIPHAIGWLPAVNALGTASIGLLVGSLQDRFGRRAILLASALTFCVASVLFGTAHSLPQAIAALIILGASAGSIELACVSGLAAIVAARWRGTIIAILLLFSLPFCPFVLYSFLFSTEGPAPTWRWAAWIPLFYTAIATVFCFIFYHPKRPQTTTDPEQNRALRKIDYVGAMLSVSGVALLLFALQSGGTICPWESAEILSTLVIGVLLCVAFVIWEARFAPDPMIPRRLYTGQRFVLTATAIAFIAGMNFYILLNFWPLTLGNVWAASSVRLGLYGFALSLCLTLGSSFWNSLLSLRRGSFAAILFGAALTYTAFGGALVTTSPDTLARSGGLAALAAFGIGGLVLAGQTVSTFGCPDDLLSTCVALVATARTLGGAIGVSIASAVYTNRLVSQLPQALYTAVTAVGVPAANATAIVHASLAHPGQPTLWSPSIQAALAEGMRVGYAKSLSPIWYISVASGACAMLGCLLIPRKELESDIPAERM